MTSALEVLAHSAALQLAEKTDDNNDDDELSLDLRRQSIISSFATLSLEDSASFNSEDLHLHRHHRKDNDDDDNVVTDAADLAVIAPPAPAASGKEKAADSATELRKVFRLKADEKIVYSFRTQLLDVSLLNAHVAITPTHLCVLAALQPEPQSGYLTAGNRKYWAAIENGALCAYADRDPAKHAYAPVFRKACADIVNVNAVSVAESGADTAQPHHATRFRVSMKVDFDSMAFDAPSDGEARSWIVALRLAAQAARTPTLKRVIPLTRITSVHAPVNDFVFGGRCVTLTVGVREPEQLWFVGMPNAQEVLEQLSLVWIEQLLSPDAGFEESPADAHPLQLQFEKLFKLGGDESLRHAASASLVLKTGFLVSAQLFLSDHAICVLSNSTFSKLLAVVPWHSVTAVTDTTHLLMRAVSIATVGGRVVKLVLGDKLVREQIALMWKQGRTQTSDVRQRVDDDNAAENVDGNDSNYDIDDNDNDIDDEEESSSSSSSHESLPSAPQFHSKRDKAFHKRFGGDIPIDQSLQLVLHAYLVRSDAKHGGHMHVTQQFFAFASGDDMRLAMPRSSAIDSKVTGHTVALMCKGDLEFIFKFDDDDSAATFGSLVRATDSDTAAATPTDAAVHFYHNQLTAYRRMFSVSDDELLDTHTCSFVRAKLVSLPQAGQLFVGRNNVCFKATYAAYKIVVPVAEIADVVRQESVSMGRSGLRLQTTSGAFFLFVGFPALKKTIRQIKHVAVAYRNRAAVASATASPAAALATRALASEITSSHESPMSAAPPRPLRILILTIGSRGDVQPTIMLGRALRADGHDVTIATHAEFKEFVEKNDLKHDTLAGDPKALMNLCVSKGMFTPSFVREALTNFRQFIDDLLRSVYKVAKALAPDLMIQAPTVFAGKHVSEALHIPLMNWFTMPHTPTSRFAHPFAVSNMPVAAAAYNFLLFVAVRQALWQPLAGQLNAFRKEIGLEPLSRSDGPTLNDDVPIMYCFSRHLVPKPPEWQSWVHITGFWLDETQSNANYVPPQALADFLRGGERPIYVGFGSITGINDVEAFFDKVVQAMEQSGERFILLTGWANLGANRKLSDRIHVLESVPHDWLFPQCKAVVHHGGAGTVATGLRAACPTIVLAFFADQFFWASRVVELGVGHAFTAAEFEADRLRAAIVDAASNPEMKRRATQISRQLADEHGVPNARRVIYDFVHRAKIEQRLVGEPVAAHKGSHKKQQN